jgi:hypothetical protein
LRYEALFRVLTQSDRSTDCYVSSNKEQDDRKTFDNKDTPLENMATCACSVHLTRDEVSWAPTAQVSKDKIDQPCDQWQVWASKSRKRKQIFQGYFERDALLDHDDSEDLIENDYIDSQVEKHMRLECASRISLAPLPLHQNVNHKEMVQHQKKPRGSNLSGDSTTLWRAATPRIRISLSKASR